MVRLSHNLSGSSRTSVKSTPHILSVNTNDQIGNTNIKPCPHKIYFMIRSQKRSQTFLTIAKKLYKY